MCAMCVIQVECQQLTALDLALRPGLRQLISDVGEGDTTVSEDDKRSVDKRVAIVLPLLVLGSEVLQNVPLEADAPSLGAGADSNILDQDDIALVSVYQNAAELRAKFDTASFPFGIDEADFEALKSGLEATMQCIYDELTRRYGSEHAEEMIGEPWFQTRP